MTLKQDNIKMDRQDYFVLGAIAAVAVGALALPLWRRFSRPGLTIGTETPLERKFGDGRHDAIEEASWESFPASDPPAW